MNGYECVYLRTYYPLEFITAYLNRAEDKIDINNGIALADRYNINIKPISFGKSKAAYTLDRSDNSIYKGIASIKFCNSQIADEMYELAQNNTYDNAVDCFVDVMNKTSINSRQMKILITLGFFDQFGRNKTLLDIHEMVDSLKDAKQINKDKISKLGLQEGVIKQCAERETEKLYKDLDMLRCIKMHAKLLPDKSLSIKDQIGAEVEYLEYPLYTNPSISGNFYYVLEFKTYNDKTKPYLKLYNMKTGDTVSARITSGKAFMMAPFAEKSVLNITKHKMQPKKKKIGTQWVDTDEMVMSPQEWEVY